MIPIIQHPKGLTFKVFVQPRSSRNQILGLHGDALKIKLTAPPVNDAANRMCIQYDFESIIISQLGEIVKVFFGN